MSPLQDELPGVCTSTAVLTSTWCWGGGITHLVRAVSPWVLSILSLEQEIPLLSTVSVSETKQPQQGKDFLWPPFSGRASDF